MKNLRLSLLLLLAVGLLGWTGCADDDDPLVRDTLNYDGANLTAPNLDANMFAAYFPADVVRQFAGRQLAEVQFFLTAIPPSTRVFVFAEGPTDQAPGEELYSEDITQRVNASGDFIVHRLSEVVTLADQGIWIGIETDIAEGVLVQSVGCDDGSNYNSNGDRIRIGNTWTSFREITGSERVNWNIRGVIAEE